jgi:hypothetical protein
MDSLSASVGARVLPLGVRIASLLSLTMHGSGDDDGTNRNPS